MKKTQLWQKFVLSAIGLVLMIIFTACSSIGTNGNGSINSITGTITSVNAANHTVTLNVNGQTYTIGNLSDQEIQALQAQVGKVYTIQVTQNSNQSFSITAGTNPVLGDNNETPGVNETPDSEGTPSNTSETGSISFTGPVQSASGSSLAVKMPDGSILTMTITAQSDLSDLNGAQLRAGQLVKVDVQASANGFVADTVKLADSGDQADANTVDFQGTTTQAVGSDRVLHFTVGNRGFSYAISAGADLSDFGGNANSIANSTAVDVTVQFNGTTGSIIKVSNPNS